MSCCPKESPEDIDQRRKSIKIDEDIKRHATESRKHAGVKLLLLGAGESGKSTILKQFKLIHGGGFTNIEIERYRDAIFGNIVGAMKILITEMERMEISMEMANAEACIRTIQEAPYWFKTEAGKEEFSKDLVESMKSLWADPGTQKCMERANEFQMLDSIIYFMSNIDRIATPGYIPTNDDALRARIMTTTITENRFDIMGLEYRIYDVGGQRSQRKKWFSFFDDCIAVIFLAAVGSYDQLCSEDNETNRMVEALTLFDAICNNPLLSTTAMIIFMNKIDLLKEKLESKPLGNYFSDYTGPDEITSALSYFGTKFAEVNRYPDKKLYIYSTQATDTSQVATVFVTVRTIITKLNLQKSGL
ncbi:G-protein alpha subunit [Polychytrium aggregatum]|uniref:G-protein alpha subunit n=1 Tax=Polychytrium aggregatum TaxID=110093 RepID=UPI0022FDF866|nr:G-protein alpha subunit [Polychytrium aggregatum]KAI9199720.1 G-protein alpha subunit [Polychytrium aggregatum]